MLQPLWIAGLLAMAGCPEGKVEKVPQAQFCAWVAAAEQGDPTELEVEDQIFLYCSDESITECVADTDVRVVSWEAWRSTFDERDCFMGPTEEGYGTSRNLVSSPWADCVGLDTGQVERTECWLPVGWDKAD